jgi:SAM-dependent methyltransferase
MITKISIGWLYLLLLPGMVAAKETTEDAFTTIYETCVWGHDSEGHGISGAGSKVEHAKPYMQFLQKFLNDNNIKSVVDVGCGDWTFSQYIDWSGILYIGYDVVKSVVEKNNISFSGSNCQFIHGDALTIDLPVADLLICKDVLQHLPNNDIKLFLKQCSKFKHCLITNDYDVKTGSSKNKDISAKGGWHTIDLTQPPFNVEGFKIFNYLSEGENRKQVLHIVQGNYRNPCKTVGIQYKFTHEPIDVVIPCVKKDLETLNLAIDGIKKNGKNIRNIFVISPEPITKKATWIDEKKFPFSKSDIALQILNGDKNAANQFISHKDTKIGWLYQQFLKLYAPFVIPNISENILLLDSDTIFLNPVEFQDDAGAALFNPGTEYHRPYFDHMARLIPWLTKTFPFYSGISHHMLFQKDILCHLFDVITSIHHVDPWIALCRCTDLKHIFNSALSEFEIYFNFSFMTTNQVSVRYLKWENIEDLKLLDDYRRRGYHYVSRHVRYGSKLCSQIMEGKALEVNFPKKASCHHKRLPLKVGRVSVEN